MIHHDLGPQGLMAPGRRLLGYTLPEGFRRTHTATFSTIVTAQNTPSSNISIDILHITVAQYPGRVPHKCGSIRNVGEHDSAGSDGSPVSNFQARQDGRICSDICAIPYDHFTGNACGRGNKRRVPYLRLVSYDCTGMNSGIVSDLDTRLDYDSFLDVVSNADCGWKSDGWVYKIDESPAFLTNQLRSFITRHRRP